MSNIKTINLIYAISFLDLFAVGLTVPLFSTHLRELGVSHTVIGLLSSTYSGIQVLSGPIIGGWSDIRDRKYVLKITLLICGVCYGLLGITESIFFIFILRFILGIMKHTQSICKAVITDLVPHNEQTGIFGRSAAFSSVGFIIGPFIGGHLSEINHGFTYVCGLTVTSFIINFVPLSLASTTLRVVSMELMLKKSEKMHRGSLSGASNSIMSVARFVTPFLSGILSDIFSEQSVMLVAMIPAVLGMCVSLYMKFVYVNIKK
ncbi:hypothetical protein NQ314_008426 [Rhamnusium bicolor]|uniref:Major facilitator superfamily (MFS) profile domain-containing protein n=1 Tax=Rhamnusium bicolor TaxID=1586634 RepID=A0AAV8YBN6_9CUCU|nr:hypothetical protein NQ314_008426 [Rhamnusium bicolor]